MTPTAARIPEEMWEAIRTCDTLHAAELQHCHATHRKALIDIGARFGFTEDQLVKRGIVTPDKETARQI